MKAIYASKLYKASPRKEKIRAAIENPVNAELVTQLSEYLDEEYQTPQYLEGKPDPGASATSGSEGDSAGSESSGGASSGAGGFSGGGGGSAPTDMHLDDVVLDKDGNPIEDPEAAGGEVDGDGMSDESLDAEGVEDFDAPADDMVDDVNLDEIEESTEIEGVASRLREPSAVDVAQPPVVEEEVIDAPPTTKEETLLGNNVESIKLMLNADEETEGVERISLKNSELWIYYNDFVNLNNIMSPVIEFFARGSFTYLEFNRLARSANAIVFQICTNNKR